MTTTSVDPDLVQEIIANLMLVMNLNNKTELPNDLRHRQFHFLTALTRLMGSERKGIKASEMSEEMHITRGAITHIINQMEADGLVERFSDPSDRRIVLIRPTGAGYEILEESKQHFFHAFQGFVNFLGENDTKELNRILARTVTYQASQILKNR